MKKVEGHSNLYKKSNGVIVNTDWSSYEKAKKRKKEKQRIDDLENRLGRIEELLTRLVSK